MAKRVNSPRRASSYRRPAGSIREKRPGVWQCRVTVGRDEAGRRIVRHATVEGGRADAERRLRELLDEAGQVEAARDGRTLDQLWEAWRLACEPGWSPSTAAEHEVIRRRIGRVLPDQLVERLDARTIEWAYGRLATKLKPSTVRRTHSALHAMLTWAHMKGHIESNPMDLVTAPPVPESEVTPIDPEALVAFLEWLERHAPKYYALYRLFFATGARRGELLALRWEEIRGNSVAFPRVLVRDKMGREVLRPRPKNKKIRSIAVGAPTLEALQLLGTSKGFVFSDNGGRTPWRLERATKEFRRLQRRAGIELGHLHQIRHTAATLGLARGYSARQVADRLGHDPAMLLRTYAAWIPAHDVSLAEEFDSLIDQKADGA